MKSIRVFISLSVFLFTFAVIMGYLAAELDPQIASNWTKELEMLKWIMDQPAIMIVVIIFLKNLLACAISILLGIGLGITPFLVVASNGFLIGIVAFETIKKAGVFFLLAGIVPHGIIELPVVLISIAIGFRLGWKLFTALIGRDSNLSSEMRMALHFLLHWIMPLLFIAAAIETFITPIVISVVT